MASELKPAWWIDVGVVKYATGCELQKLFVGGRKAGRVPDVLLLCAHPPVITLGRNGDAANLRASERVLKQMGIEYRLTDRGGDITYHGPGQIVGYPIMDLTEHRRDVRWYVAQLEEVMIRTAEDFGVAAHRVDGMHGVWVDTERGSEKLGALGVHLSRWVTSHGFAFNVATDLRHFDLIVPCGLVGKQATSLEKVLGRVVDVERVKARVVKHFGDVFGMEITKAKVESALGAGVAPG
jgi:lipoyl(octanoyl) transferase